MAEHFKTCEPSVMNVLNFNSMSRKSIFSSPVSSWVYEIAPVVCLSVHLLALSKLNWHSDLACWIGIQTTILLWRLTLIIFHMSSVVKANIGQSRQVISWMSGVYCVDPFYSIVTYPYIFPSFPYVCMSPPGAPKGLEIWYDLHVYYICLNEYCIHSTFQSVNPSHGQWPAPTGSWRVLYFTIQQWHVQRINKKPFMQQRRKIITWWRWSRSYTCTPMLHEA